MRLALLATLLLSAMAGHGQALTVASCPTATSGTAWAAGTWLPCTPPAVYVAPPLPAGTLINDMRCASTPCVFKWTNQAGILSTDQTWAKTTAAPAGQWIPASSVTWASSAPPYTATAIIVWVAPTQNTDGTPLTDLAGFNVYSGPTAASLIKVGNVAPTALTYSITVGLGTTYFAVTAVNAAGTESVYSAVVSKLVTQPAPSVPNPPTIFPPQ